MDGGTGYNGAPAGHPNCFEGACPRGLHFKRDELSYQGREVCARGTYWACPEAATPVSSYDTGAGSCIAIHAEANTLLSVDRRAMVGATMYITRLPCDGCMKLIQGAGIVRIVAAITTVDGPGKFEWVDLARRAA